MLKFRELTADERTRDMYERREKARRDQVSRERWAVKQRDLEIAKKLLNAGDPIDKIVMITGLTREEIEELNNAG